MLKQIIDVNETFGTKYLLTDIKPINQYNESKEKTGVILGYNYEVCLIERKFEKINVKIEGINPPLFDIEKEEIPDNIFVKFENIICTPYIHQSNRIALSTKATNVFVDKNIKNS